VSGKDLRCNFFSVKIDINKKEIIHSCNEFDRIYRDRKFCKHILHIFLYLDEHYKKGYEIFINKFLSEIKKYKFKIME